MIDRDTIDKVEQYLFNSTMDELPNVLGRVLPWMFSEMRILVDLQEAKTEEFFSAGTTRNNRNAVADGASAGQAGLVDSPDQALSTPTQDAPDPAGIERTEVSVTREAELLARLAADRGVEGRGDETVERGAMESEVGGPLRTGEGNQPDSRGKQVDAVLKPQKRRRK